MSKKAIGSYVEKLSLFAFGKNNGRVLMKRVMVRKGRGMIHFHGGLV